MKLPPAFRIGAPSYFVAASTSGSARPIARTATNASAGACLFDVRFIDASIRPCAARFKRPCLWLPASAGRLPRDLELPPDQPPLKLRRSAEALRAKAEATRSCLARAPGRRNRMSRMLIRTSATVLTLVLALTGHAFADVQLPGIISDHMLLQRDVPVRIFGKAQPGEAVSVVFRGQTVSNRDRPAGTVGSLAAAAHQRPRGRHDHPGDEQHHRRRCPGRRCLDWLRSIEHAMGRPSIGQRRCGNRVSQLPADPPLLRAPKNIGRARRGRGRQMGRLLAGVGEGVLGGPVLFWPRRCTRIARCRWG